MRGSEGERGGRGERGPEAAGSPVHGKRSQGVLGLLLDPTLPERPGEQVSSSFMSSSGAPGAPRSFQAALVLDQTGGRLFFQNKSGEIHQKQPKMLLKCSFSISCLSFFIPTSPKEAEELGLHPSSLSRFHLCFIKSVSSQLLGCFQDTFV